MNRLKRLISVALLVVGLFTIGLFRPAVAAEYPQVANLAPYTIESTYMSLAGYLRFLVFQQTGEWISRDEAVRIVAQQESAS